MADAFILEGMSGTKINIKERVLVLVYFFLLL